MIINYKKQAALEAAKMVSPDHVVGLGDGSTIALLAEALVSDKTLSGRLSFVSSSARTSQLLRNLGVAIANAADFETIDLYFDGCDQIDSQLNALKSGGGIHTDEKSLAAMANEFVILGDGNKLKDALNTDVPFTVEVIPASVKAINMLLRTHFDIVSTAVRKDNNEQEILTKRACVLLDVTFAKMPQPEHLNQIRMWPGVIDHSLFYKIVTSAIICDAGGVRHLGSKPLART